MDMAVKGEEGLKRFDKLPDGAASYKMPPGNDIQGRCERRRVHYINRLSPFPRSGNFFEVFCNGSLPPEMRTRIDRGQVVGRLGRANIGRAFLRRPERFEVVHLFVILGPERGRGDKGIADEFMAARESKPLSVQVHKPFRGGGENLRIGRVPVARDEKDPRESGFQAPPEEGQEKGVDKVSLLPEHLFVAAGFLQRGEEIAAENKNLRPPLAGVIQDLPVENLFSVKVGSKQNLHKPPAGRR